MNISIKSMSIDGHNVPVPHGLSELLNRAGAWSSEEVSLPRGYQREVKWVDGRLVTELTYVGDTASTDGFARQI